MAEFIQIIPQTQTTHVVKTIRGGLAIRSQRRSSINWTRGRKVNESVFPLSPNQQNIPQFGSFIDDLLLDLRP